MKNNLSELSRTVRHHILTSTTEAGSGHPTSSMSAVELTVGLMFESPHFHQNLTDPHAYYNDRLIFSKGHAAPLLYSLYTVAGGIGYDELMTLRKKGSRLEGHPTPLFPYAQITTGSLGQGLSVGLGMALGIKLRHSQRELRNEKWEMRNGQLPKVYVLMGDSESAEGQIYEAAQAASYYKVDNLVAILDVNRLGQRGPTMLEWDLDTYRRRFEAYGWNAVVIEDGHDMESIRANYDNHLTGQTKPTIFIAKTMKGRGVSFLENKDGWHGKPVPKDKLGDALKELGEVDAKLTGTISTAGDTAGGLIKPANSQQLLADSSAPQGPYSTREAYGDALVALGAVDPDVVAVDGETGNSTFSEKFQKAYPERFFEMYIAEQNMVSVALGLSKLGFKPYASTFAAFLSRAFDQIRMGQYSDANINICGSHAGVSIGQDGASQMGLEDLSMMASVLPSVVLYPSDAVSTHGLVASAAAHEGLVYIRTTREKTPIIYSDKDSFTIGGSRIVHQSDDDRAVIFTAGITLHEAMKAYEMLKKDGINIAIVDTYSVKPLDTAAVASMVAKNAHVIVIEDHYPTGGLGTAIADYLVSSGAKVAKFSHLCVREIPHTASAAELLATHGLDAAAIVNCVKAS